jgi:hypothetical protein
LAELPYSGEAAAQPRVRVRGGDQYAHGSKSYNGTGELIVSDDGSVTIGCHGSFVGILP